MNALVELYCACTSQKLKGI
ncbi:hypothetical protein Trydic_g19302, partial [Trypoxylus dichotomus]